jgi:hypothetical protein
MKSIISHECRIYVAILCGCVLFASESQAQYPGSRFGGVGAPGTRPPVSPYLNLLNQGDPAINYYGLVKPQFAYNRALQNLGNELNYLETTPQGGNLPPSQTGIRATFMTQYRYFMNNGYGAGAGYRPGTGGNYPAGGVNPNQQMANPAQAGGHGQPPQGQPRY